MGKNIIVGLGVFLTILGAQASEELIFEKTDSVELCTIPLPVTQSRVTNRLFVGMKHVYLKVADKTYGTPFTNKQTYLGGDAFLYTEDIFYKDQSLSSGVEKCYPVNKKITDTHENFARRVECIADKLSISSLHGSMKQKKEWYPIFDYHFLKNNCSSMVSYLLECSGGQAGKMTNFSVGDKVPMTKRAKLVTNTNSNGMSRGAISEASTYGDVCQKAKDECSEFEEDLEEVTALADL